MDAAGGGVLVDADGRGEEARLQGDCVAGGQADAAHAVELAELAEFAEARLGRLEDLEVVDGNDQVAILGLLDRQAAGELAELEAAQFRQRDRVDRLGDQAGGWHVQPENLLAADGIGFDRKDAGGRLDAQRPAGVGPLPRRWRTCAAARVAWPHILTSTSGVNQRMRMSASGVVDCRT